MNKFKAEYINRFKAFQRNAPRLIATNAENFFKDRFIAQNWLDRKPKKWKERKYKTGRKTDERAILTKSGTLQRSIRITSETFDKIAVASLDVSYAQTHNDGFKGKVSQHVREQRRRPHTRKGYTTRKGRKVSPARVRAYDVQPYNRNLKMNIPRRRFLGKSQTLINQTKEILEREFKKVFN